MIVVLGETPSYVEDFNSYFTRRQKRSIDDGLDGKKSNNTIKFFNTVDELNEDTLKNSNASGTITANQVPIGSVPKTSRRTTLLDNKQAVSTSLHINYNQPEEYDHHLNENKVDPLTQNEKRPIIFNQNLKNILGNHSQTTKDKEISKIVVNELKSGKEVIGDKQVTPMSNITFTPENDTLTAMAFIAGNLLNKLWHMEKDSSDNSFEVDSIKHQKINDLLDLFKEPLSIRQETFLKNVLENLSDTLDKNRNIKNISVCETFQDPNISIQDSDGDSFTIDNGKNTNYGSKCKGNKSEKNINQNNSNIKQNIEPKVMYKLNNVLNLINKYENVQKSLHDKKESTETLNVTGSLPNQEDSSLLLFENILEKVLKLLLPNNNKRITNKIRKLNKLEHPHRVAQNLFDRYNIHLSDLNITTKDKLVLDYLDHIENNPKCLFSKHSQISNFNSDIKGDILYNLSEILKMKSFGDFIKLINPENRVKEAITTITTSEIPETTSKLSARTQNSEKNIYNLQNIRDSLKSHLKAIIDDIMQLQNGNNVSKGKNTDINIIEIIPCIYNALNNDKLFKSGDTAEKYESNSMDKINSLIDSMKLELKNNIPSRRMNTIKGTKISKGVKIWERVINNIQRNNRRNLINNDNKPKTYEQIKHMIEQIETPNAAYKNNILLTGIAPSEKLVLLKTLGADVKKRTIVLKYIKDILDVILRLPLQQQKVIIKFIENSKSSVELDTIILNKIRNDKSSDTSSVVEVQKNLDRRNKKLNEFNQDLKLPLILDESLNEKNRNTKFTRQQLINQLMVNKVRAYLELQDAEKTGSSVTYNIAKRILYHLKSGNERVARELFKIFIVDKEKDVIMNSRNRFNVVQRNGKKSLKPRQPLLLALNEPLIRFEEFKDEAQSQDHLLKQLMSLRNVNS